MALSSRCACIRMPFGARTRATFRYACFAFSTGASRITAKPVSTAKLFAPRRLLPNARSRAFAVSTTTSYDAGNIQVLEGLEPVRKRPGMYIGTTGPRGLHHLINEVLDNAIDEVQAGFATNVDVVLHSDGAVSVVDNGRGIPTDIHPSTGKSALETVLTVLHAGGKFGGDDSGYTVSGGLHGVGVSVVNALSKRLDVTVWRNGHEYHQAFERGKPITSLKRKGLPNEQLNRTGTCVTFLPDDEVFTTTTKFDYSTVSSRLREVAFLNPQVTIKLMQEESDTKGTKFHYSGGLVEYVRWLCQDKASMHDPISFTSEKNGVTVEVALQWCSDAYADTLLGYANSIRTADGGTHLDGLKAALTRTLNNFGRKAKAIKEKDDNLSGEHVREGLTAIISVKVPNPEFEGQTKTKLGNVEVRKIVEQAVQENVTEFLELHAEAHDAILSKAIQAYKAAEAAKKARELVRRKNILRTSTLPGKLADCTCRDPGLAEIFIVEGESAGGSAKQGRDREFQAVLPLKGKILNIERKDDAAIYKNQELQDLIVALGLGTKGEEFQKNSLRYHKIIILTDADVDGAHIRTLLLTFFFRYQRALFEEGFVYVGVPPLYRVEKGKHVSYCYSEDELRALPRAGYSIQRFKGLGEMMPLQLWETTLDPSKRMLKRLSLADAAEASITFSRLMGDKVEPRKELIQKSASFINLEHLDL